MWLLRMFEITGCSVSRLYLKVTFDGVALWNVNQYNNNNNWLSYFHVIELYKYTFNDHLAIIFQVSCPENRSTGKSEEKQVSQFNPMGFFQGYVFSFAFKHVLASL